MQTALPGGGTSEPPFFKLPAELRNVIYKDVLGDLSNAFTCFGGVNYVQYRRVSLLFVNRQMYQDTHLLPYSMNSITAGPRTGFKEWMARRTQNQLRAMARLHFVLDTFGYHTSHVLLPRVATDFGYARANNLTMDSLFQQQLAFPELTGLKHILVELRSHSEDVVELIQQIEFLQEAKVQIKKLNPRADVTVELICLGCELRLADIPASSATGLRIVRFDNLIEGGQSVHDILARRGLVQSIYNDPERMEFLRKKWHTVTTTQG